MRSTFDFPPSFLHSFIVLKKEAISYATCDILRQGIRYSRHLPLLTSHNIMDAREDGFQAFPKFQRRLELFLQELNGKAYGQDAIGLALQRPNQPLTSGLEIEWPHQTDLSHQIGQVTMAVSREDGLPMSSVEGGEEERCMEAAPAEGLPGTQGYKESSQSVKEDLSGFRVITFAQSRPLYHPTLVARPRWKELSEANSHPFDAMVCEAPSPQCPFDNGPAPTDDDDHHIPDEQMQARSSASGQQTTSITSPESSNPLPSVSTPLPITRSNELSHAATALVGRSLRPFEEEMDLTEASFAADEAMPPGPSNARQFILAAKSHSARHGFVQQGRSPLRAELGDLTAVTTPGNEPSRTSAAALELEEGGHASQTQSESDSETASSSSMPVVLPKGLNRSRLIEADLDAATSKRAKVNANAGKQVVSKLRRSEKTMRLGSSKQEKRLGSGPSKSVGRQGGTLAMSEEPPRKDASRYQPPRNRFALPRQDSSSPEPASARAGPSDPHKKQPPKSTSALHLEAAPSNATAASKTTAQRKTKAPTLPAKRPIFKTLADCLAQWTQWINAGMVQPRSDAFLRNQTVLLICPRWDSKDANLVDRLIIRGATVVDLISCAASNRPWDHAVVVKGARMPSLEEITLELRAAGGNLLKRVGEGMVVNSDWVGECINLGRLVSKDREEWRVKL